MEEISKEEISNIEEEKPEELKIEFSKLETYFDTRFFKLNNSVRLLKSVLHSKRTYKKFGMGLGSIYKTISIIFQEYYNQYLESEKSNKCKFL